MRVFCHEHKRGFLAPRQSPITCENRGHVLGEMDFNGGAKQVFHTQWQYCCNCEHFCVVDFEGETLERCPVCTRRTSMVYLCERCYTVSFESNTPLQTKNFTLTAEGSPRPCCPACLLPAPADLREHTCDDAKVSFVTGLKTCPICAERLDVGPTFPSLVAQYLRRTMAANKCYVTFDYETGLFVPVDDGEFVVISNNEDRTLLLPRSPRLASHREFYELYQDYYLCLAPDTGDITITEPAVLLPTNNGWQLRGTGVIEIVNQPRQTTVTAPPPQLPVPKPEVVPIRQVETKELSTPCERCHTPVESKYAFCWKCGHPREENGDGLRPERARLTIETTDDEDLDESLEHDSDPAAASRLAALLGEAKSRRLPGSILRLLGVAVVGFVLMTLAMFTLSRSRANNTTATQSITSAALTVGAPAATAEAQLKTPSPQAPTISAEDSALAKVRQMPGTEASKLLKSLSETEKKYADDYRFPYERARIVVKSRTKNYHVEAFAALTRAAQKAISRGKAGEMLKNLKTDSAGDFQLLAHGHREWAQLQKALKNQDMAVLDESQGF